jgi:hypothetical protein
MPINVTELIDKIYGGSKPVYDNPNRVLRNEEIKLEYQCLVINYGLRCETARLILSQLTGLKADTINSILYRKG